LFAEGEVRSWGGEGVLSKKTKKILIFWRMQFYSFGECTTGSCDLIVKAFWAFVLKQHDPRPNRFG